MTDSRNLPSNKSGIWAIKRLADAMDAVENFPAPIGPDEYVCTPDCWAFMSQNLSVDKQPPSHVGGIPFTVLPTNIDCINYSIDAALEGRQVLIVQYNQPDKLLQGED